MDERFSKESPTVLAIETSGSLCEAAILKTDGTVARLGLDLERGHAERVVELCTTLLREEAVEWSAVTHVAVNKGPGSFAGVRAGVAAARGFALSLAVPALGVSTFEATVEGWNARRNGAAGTLLVLTDLRRGWIGAQIFAQTPSEGTIKAAGEPFSTEPDHIALTLRPNASVGGPVDILSSLDANGALLTRAVASLRDSGIQARVHTVPPSAEHVARVALNVLMEGRASPADPLYMRSADAVPAARLPILQDDATRHREAV